MKGLITRRFVGFIVATVAMLIEPEVAPYAAAIYGALVGAAITDSIKGSSNG